MENPKGGWMGSINRIVLSGGLTRDPELRETPGGTSVATLRVAFATLRKVDGQWQERPNYIDVELWGLHAENAVTYLSKGRQIAVDGRLEWTEYESASGTRIQQHRLVADSVQYLGGNERREAQPAGTDDVDTGDHGAEDSFDETSRAAESR
jgi:single-strand DNA-binding protein